MMYYSKSKVKEFGEVLTPLWLVEDMLNTLPDEVWHNPNLKWLDPCVGTGNFIQVIVQRLMKGLEWCIPNEQERYKHIMEEMIYVCELQPKNVFLYMYAFDPENKYALNIYNGSYLSEGFNKHMLDLGVEKFDVIVMNPPYNGDNTKSKGGAVSSLWDKFVDKTIDNLTEGGHLVAVHPSKWREIDGKFKTTQQLIRSKQILYLEMHNKWDGFKTFGAHTTYDFYCLQNVPNLLPTKIKCLDGSIERVNLSKMEFIPGGMFKMFEKLICKDNEEKVNVLYNCAYHNQKEYMSEEQTADFKYPCVYYTYKDESLRLFYSATNQKGHFGIPKVIWSRGGASTPFIDANGEYGVMNFACAIIDEPDKLPRIKQAMLNPEFLKLMELSDGVGGVGGQRYNRKIIGLFRKDFWMDFI